MPVPANFPQEKENRDHDYEFVSTFRKEREDPHESWTEGAPFDGKGEFSFDRQSGGGPPNLEKTIEEMCDEATQQG